jgi:uncharacterized glyoxalase superfamily protein PhnB
MPRAPRKGLSSRPISFAPTRRTRSSSTRKLSARSSRCACVTINGAPIFLVDENPQWDAKSPKTLKGSPVTIHLQVEDVDALYNRAVKAGATARMPPADMFWGDRYGVLVDPFGHSWSIATHQRDMTQAEIKEAMMAEFAAHGQKG